MKKIKFSIIVPVYNVESYLSRCLDSILNQTNTDYEIICINDGSTDSSSDILKNYKKKHAAIFTIINQKNKGLGGARNAGVSYATGDYIWFVDSDDWIEKNALEKLEKFIFKTGKKDIILFDVFSSNAKMHEILYTIPNCNESIFSFDNYVYHLFNRHALYAAWAKIFNCEKYKNSGYQFENGFYEDIPLINYYVKNNCTMSYLHEPLYYYYEREDSIMKTYDARILSVFKQFLIVNDSLKQYEKYKKPLAAFFFKLMIETSKRMSNVDNNNIKIEFWKRFRTINRRFGFVTKYGLFNDQMLYKRRVRIIINILFPMYYSKLFNR